MCDRCITEKIQRANDWSNVEALFGLLMVISIAVLFGCIFVQIKSEVHICWLFASAIFFFLCSTGAGKVQEKMEESWKEANKKFKQKEAVNPVKQKLEELVEIVEKRKHVPVLEVLERGLT